MSFTSVFSQLDGTIPDVWLCLFFLSSPEDLCFKLFYVRPDKVSGTLRKGERIGTMLPMQTVYPGITSHVHVQMCDRSDPTHYFWWAEEAAASRRWSSGGVPKHAAWFPLAFFCLYWKKKVDFLSLHSCWADTQLKTKCRNAKYDKHEKQNFLSTVVTVISFFV